MASSFQSIPNAESKHWPRSLRSAIAFWAILYFALIGGGAALQSGIDSRDADVRADLARHGVRARGVISGRGSPVFIANGGCGRSSIYAVVQFRTPNGKAYNQCVSYDDVPSAYFRFMDLDPPSETAIDVVYDPKDPNYALVAPDGVVPQRKLDGAFLWWAEKTFALMAIFVPATSIVLYYQRKRKPA